MKSRMLIAKDKYPYRILVVEDNLGDFILVEDYLEETMSSVSLDRSETYAEASASLQNGRYDVILLDLTLPDMELSNLIQHSLKIAGNIPIIVLTGYQNMDFTTEALKSGISDYILKDEINATLLYKTIIYSIQRSKYLRDLKESEKRYFDLFQLSPSPKWIFDPETYDILEVNQATSELYGFSNEEFRKMNMNDFILSDDQDYFDKTAKHYTLEKSRDKQFRFRKKDGSVVISQTNSTEIIYNGNPARLLLTLDITDQINMQKELLNITYQIEDQERSRISSAIHDGIQQELLATYKTLESVYKHSENLQSKYHDRFQTGLKLLNQTLLKARSLAHELIPPSLEKLGFKGALNEVIDRFENIDFNYYEQTHGIQLSMDTQLLLFRVSQELINNIVKHSEANEASLELEVKNNTIYLVALDDGIGFDMNKNLGLKSFGLSSIKQRIESLKGFMDIHSQKGKGTKVVIRIPLI